MAEFIPDFDYGGEIAEKDDNFKLWPTEGERVALVDADLLPYAIAFIVDDIRYQESLTLVSSGYYNSLKETPYYLDYLDSLYAMLNRWIKLAKCDSAKLFTTRGSTNFRLDIAYTDPYKEQRNREKPPFFEELRSDMISTLNTIQSVKEEADDLISIEAWEHIDSLGLDVESLMFKEMIDCVVISSDKDSKITPVPNFNPNTLKLEHIDTIGNLVPKYKKGTIKVWEQRGTGQFYTKGAKKGIEKTKRVCVGEAPSRAIEDLKGSGLKFFYAQIIMGDPADNYKGLKGKGATAAFELLDNLHTEEQMFEAVLNLYKEVHGEGTHWCPIYKGTEEYYKLCMDMTGYPPEDFEFWKGKGLHLTALDRMLEQGRLAWMQTYTGEIWKEELGAVINPHDRELWYERND